MTMKMVAFTSSALNVTLKPNEGRTSRWWTTPFAAAHSVPQLYVRRNIKQKESKICGPEIKAQNLMVDYQPAPEAVCLQAQKEEHQQDRAAASRQVQAGECLLGPAAVYPLFPVVAYRLDRAVVSRQVREVGFPLAPEVGFLLGRVEECPQALHHI